MTVPRVAVVVTTYNGRADTLECLRSLAANRYPAFDVLVMDDASTDGTEEAVRAEFPSVRVVRHPSNLGYARNLNRGIELSMSADYVLVLNNDVAAAPDLVEKLAAAAAADARIAVCGPRMHYYARPDRLWAAGGTVLWLGGRTRHGGLGRPFDGDERPREVDYMPGAAMLIATRALREVGLFDASYDAFFEEVDFCCRVRAAGGRIVLVPGASLRHKVSRTFGRRLPRQKYLMARNRLWWARRCAPAGRLPAFVVADALMTAAEFAKNLLVRSARAAGGIFRGYCAGWGPLPPRTT